MKTDQLTPSQKLEKKWVELLTPLLAIQKLPCENSKARICSASEFRFIREASGVGMFEHSHTGNSLMIRRVSCGIHNGFNVNTIPLTYASDGSPIWDYELYIPTTMNKYFRGFFDSGVPTGIFGYLLNLFE